jgi:RNA polymerase sigma-70 factor (ECF subfamily)
MPLTIPERFDRLSLMWAVDPLQRYVEAAVEGDDVAVAFLIRQTQPAVWRLCAALGSAGVEEDLVQETYLRALKSLATFRGEVPVQAWMLSIARRVCADDVRRRQRARRLADRLDRYTSAQPHLDDESVEELLDSLAPDRREAFVLTQVMGLSYQEAAEVMQCPVGTVRSRVARARADLAVTVSESLAL